MLLTVQPTTSLPAQVPTNDSGCSSLGERGQGQEGQKVEGQEERGPGVHQRVQGIFDTMGLEEEEEEEEGREESRRETRRRRGVSGYLQDWAGGWRGEEGRLSRQASLSSQLSCSSLSPEDLWACWDQVAQLRTP